MVVGALIIAKRTIAENVGARASACMTAEEADARAAAAPESESMAAKEVTERAAAMHRCRASMCIDMH